MKPITQMTQVDKGEILHRLFIEEIPAIIDYIRNYAIYVLNHQGHFRELWEAKPQSLSFEEWLEVARETKEKIDKDYNSFLRNAYYFADQLFDRPHVHFVRYSLYKFAGQQPVYSKLKGMIVILFCDDEAG